MNKADLFFKNSEILIKLLPGNVYWLDRNNVYGGCNYQQAKFFGLKSPEEIVGKKNKELDFYGEYSDVAEKIDKVNLQVMAEKKPTILEEPITLKDGTELVFLSQKIPICDENNQAVGLLGISFDISEIAKGRKQLIIEKGSITSTLQQIIAHSPGHVYWKNKDGVYLGCNDIQAINFGLKKGSDVVGKTDFDLFSDKKVAEGFRENDILVMKTGQPVMAEEAALINNKPVVMLSQKVPLKNELSEIAGIIGVSIDITELKDTKQKLKKAEERLAGMISVGASIAHELRTPLTAIEMGISGVRKYLPSLIDGYTKAKQHNLPVDFILPHHYEILSTLLDDIESETSYSNTIINIILMNIKQDRMSSFNFQTSSISQCVDEAIRRYPFKSKEMELIKWHHDVDFSFNGDKMLMIHILFNLLKNALYFIEAEGKGDITIWCERKNDGKALYFRDTAKGIPEEDVSRLFEKFYTTTTNGTGLGLPFCKMVMEMFKGSISCTSKYGEFTQFVLNFPTTDHKGSQK